ncbi:bifunctional oligoribonuclease/PAP phosphatase NrnA [Patescibacteria group bacterium]|nr:bifunctional oligoribonuclease/PAP phosphatase NrnA [Patescibacteria group bacterium]
MISADLKTKIHQFKDYALEASKILIVTHKNPDGDAVGSSLALRIALRALNKQVEVAMMDSPPPELSFLPHFLKIKEEFAPEDFDLAIIVDCGGWSRTGFFVDDELHIDWPKNLVVIDHHPVQKLSPGLHLMDATASSAAEIVFYILKEWGIIVTREVALCLLTGLFTDTGGFKHTNVNEQVFRIAAELLAKGADINKITRSVYGNKKIAQLKLWGKIINNLKINSEYGLVFSVVTQADLNEFNLTEDDVSGILDLIRGVIGTKASLLLSEKEDEIRGSLRTEETDVDVSKLAVIFGGGGHIKAAGFSLPKNIIS